MQAMFRIVLCMLVVNLLATGARANEIPAALIVEMRLFEARSMTPDYQAMEELSFFIDTDGVGVSDRQWLSTIARKVPDSFLATLAVETVAVEDNAVSLALTKRSRRVETTIDLDGYVEDAVFKASVRGELRRGDEPQRSFDNEIELEVGKTFVWSSPDLELSASEYLSHFRDYEGSDERRELYDRLRDYATFLIVAATLRLGSGPAEPHRPVTLKLPAGTELPALESALGIEVVGTIEMELDIADDGTPTDVRIIRSSLPEVNPRILGEAPSWRFPEASGKTGRLVLEVRADP